jgi:DNA-directed RNA polymerase specialized sigma subunit
MSIYLNEDELAEAVNRHRTAPTRETGNTLALMFLRLGDEIQKKWNFSYIDREDLSQEGVIILFEKLHRWDVAKGTAFNFFTTLLLNHWRQCWRKESGHRKLLERLMENLVAHDRRNRDGRGPWVGTLQNRDWDNR